MHNSFPLNVLVHKKMSDNEIEDVQFLPGPSAGKRCVYEPKGLEKCKQVICSPARAALVITAALALIFLIALIASLARPPSACKSHSNSDKAKDGPTTPSSGADESFPWKDIRLPTSVLPSSYDLFIHPSFQTFTFNGTVDIVLDVTETTDFFLFHIKNMTLVSQELHEWNAETKTHTEEIAIINVQENKAHEQVYMKTGTDLKANKQYKLYIKFNGWINDNLAGFYRSSYETPTGEKRWIATTHFEASDARAAFPCFDEPEMKANFSLSMVRDGDHISLFNTEKVATKGFEEVPGMFVDRFAESVKMSTYLVAFIVCDYDRLTDVTPDGKNVSIYAPTDLIDEAKLAMEVSPEILTFYEQFYNIPYPLSKSDHIAVPDFAAGAMENWGLITYRMSALLVNDETASPVDKQWVVIVIAHELAHQWFGNIVTMKWWNDLWLNEGFASFMEYKGTDKVRPQWKMWDQFLTSTTWRAFSNDGLRSSHPISVDVNDPKEIEEIFDAISYDKGASVIRMCDFFLGEESFREGLQLYLRRHQFSNAETKDLWDALSEKASDSAVNVADIMDTWTRQMGYPLVTVKLEGNTLSATQERFLYNPESTAPEEYTSPYGYKWYIPLSYSTSDTPYDSKTTLAWMNKGPVTLTIPGSPNWVKVNVNCSSLYRVHYEGDLWDRLIEQLKQDHLVFTTADRAHLIEDAFALTRSGHLGIDKAMSLVTYLPKEKEYVPWFTALHSLSYISGLMEDKADYVHYQKFLRHLINEQLTDVWTLADDHLQKFLQSHIIEQALQLRDKETIDHALKIFGEWMTDKKVVSPMLKSLVYASGAKFGGQPEWEFLWKQYENPDTPMDKKSYLRAMTATTDSIRIMRLLDWSINPEKVRSADAVSVFQQLAANPASQVLTWNFIKQNWPTIFPRYKNMAFQMKHIIDSTKYFSSEFYYNDVKEFFHANLKGQDERSVNQALESIEMNIAWLKNNQAALVTWLKKWNEDNAK